MFCRIPIFLMRSTSPRLDVGTCASCYEAIRLLRNGMALFFVGACWAGRVLSSGDLVFCITSSAKHASRRAASFGDGVASLAVAHTFVAVASGAEVSSDVNMGCVADGETAGGVAVSRVTGAPVPAAAVYSLPK